MHIQSITRWHGYPLLLVLCAPLTASLLVACGGKSDNELHAPAPDAGGSHDTNQQAGTTSSAGVTTGNAGHGGANGSANAGGNASAGDGAAPSSGSPSTAGAAGEVASGGGGGAPDSCTELGGACDYASECCSRFC